LIQDSIQDYLKLRARIFPELSLEDPIQEFDKNYGEDFVKISLGSSQDLL